ncbi:MAG: HPr family phosphocarrier protein [Halofilum sp. (in: g-proteobacteria)]|nr:HPr family phosphocarrier protein [Halofilum sp. (in: g-proteobacteria)]
MQTTEVRIINRLGLHARAAAKLVSLASTFASDVQLEREGRAVNAKSIMGVMMLAASQGTVLKLMVNGSDEQEALRALTDLINDYFGEGQ